VTIAAPSVYHRIRWDEGGKQHVIAVGHRLFLAGAGCLALGMGLVLLLVGHALFGFAAAGGALALAAAVVAVTL